MRVGQAVGKETLQTIKYWTHRRAYLSSPEVKGARSCSLGDVVAQNKLTGSVCPSVKQV